MTRNKTKRHIAASFEICRDLFRCRFILLRLGQLRWSPNRGAGSRANRLADLMRRHGRSGHIQPYEIRDGGGIRSDALGGYRIWGI